MGVRLPKNATEALQIDRETGTYYWEKAMNKEMKKAKVSYEEVEGCTPEEVRSGQVPELNGYTEATLKKRERIISKVKTKYWRTTHKYGVRLPHNATEALQINKEMGYILQLPHRRP